MLEQTSGVDFYGVVGTHREEVSIWRLCSVVSQGRKDTRANSRKDGLAHSMYSIAYPIT